MLSLPMMLTFNAQASSPAGQRVCYWKGNFNWNLSIRMDISKICTNRSHSPGSVRLGDSNHSRVEGLTARFFFLAKTIQPIRFPGIPLCGRTGRLTERTASRKLAVEIASCWQFRSTLEMTPNKFDNASTPFAKGFSTLDKRVPTATHISRRLKNRCSRRAREPIRFTALIPSQIGFWCPW